MAQRTRALLAAATDDGEIDDAAVGDDESLGVGRDGARHRSSSDPSVVDRLGERLRWDPGRRGAAAVAVLALLAILATVWQVARSRPQPVSIQTSGLGSAVATVSGGPDGLTSGSPPVAAASHPVAPSSAAAPPRSPTGFLVVDVAGKVRHPGVYRLPLGSRVVDAVRAAGGPRRAVDTSSVNLAAPVSDGEQVVVGARLAAAGPGAPGGAIPVGGVIPAGGSGSTAAPDGAPVDLNTATLEQLETLPGVGPVLGQNILDWREAHGRFTTVDQLRDVNGIGDVRFGQLQPLVTLS